MRNRSFFRFFESTSDDEQNDDGDIDINAYENMYLKHYKPRTRKDWHYNDGDDGNNHHENFSDEDYLDEEYNDEDYDDDNYDESESSDDSTMDPDQQEAQSDQDDSGNDDLDDDINRALDCDFELGEEIKDSLVPYAIYWYTGEALLS